MRHYVILDLIRPVWPTILHSALDSLLVLPLVVRIADVSFSLICWTCGALIVWDKELTQLILLVLFGFETFMFSAEESCRGLLIQLLILIQVCVYCLEKLVSKFWKGSFKLILLWNVYSDESSFSWAFIFFNFKSRFFCDFHWSSGINSRRWKCYLNYIGKHTVILDKEVLCALGYIWKEELLIKFSVRLWSSPGKLCLFQGS